MDSGHIWQRDGYKKWYCLACGYRLAVRPIPQCKGPVQTCKRYAAPVKDAAATNGPREEAAGEAVAE